MKTEFKAKFLQHVAKKRKEEGFTLIELLVVIIIIGILSAIALPSFLSQANKAKQAEAKQYIASINKGHQTHYAINTSFGADIDALGIGIKTVTANYTYSTTNAVAGQATSDAQPASGLKRFGGAVVLVAQAGTGDNTTETSLCESLVVDFATLFAATDCSGADWKDSGA